MAQAISHWPLTTGVVQFQVSQESGTGQVFLTVTVNEHSTVIHISLTLCILHYSVTQFKKKLSVLTDSRSGMYKLSREIRIHLKILGTKTLI